MNTADAPSVEYAPTPASMMPGGAPVQPQAPPAVQQTATATPPVQPPAAEVTTTPTEVPIVTPPAVVDPYDAIATGDAPQAPIEWDDKGKGAFKSVFGVDDPLAYKANIEQRLQTADLEAKQLQELLPLKQQLDGLTPALKRTLQLALEGKAQEAIAYIKDMPDVVFLDKEAKGLSSEKLIKTHLPDAMSDEDFAILKDPDADPEEVKAIKAKEKHYRAIAADIHERARQDNTSKLTEGDAIRQQQAQAWTGSVAGAITAAESTKYKALVTPEFKQALHDGSFMRSFLSEGGLLTPEAGERLIWAHHGQKIAEAIGKAQYSKGKSEGLLEATSRQPGAPPIRGRQSDSGPPPDSPDALMARLMPGGSAVVPVR
jgi:gluconate kinase